MNTTISSALALIIVSAVFSTSAFALEKTNQKSKLVLPISPVAQKKETGVLGGAHGVGSLTDGLASPKIRVGRGSTRQESGKTQGEVNGRGFTAWPVGGEGHEEDGYVVIVWKDTGDEEVVDHDTYENLYEPYTDDGEAKRQIEEAEKQRKEAEEEARKAAEEEADCDEDGENCGETTVADETTVGDDDEPDGEGATEEDTVLTGNGGDTTGGVNQGDEPQSSDRYGTLRNITVPGSHIQDLPTKAVLNAEHLRTLDVIKESTGGGPIIIQETD